MPHSPESVFRSAHPEILCAWEEWKIRKVAHNKATTVFVRKYARGREVYMLDGRRVVGVSDKPGKPIPDGWVRTKKFAYLIPDRKSPQGRIIRKEMELLVVGDLRDALPGMPSVIFAGLSMCRPGATEHEGVIYVTWSCSAEDVVRNKVGDQWEPMRMSKWWAMKESTDIASKL